CRRALGGHLRAAKIADLACELDLVGGNLAGEGNTHALALDGQELSQRQFVSLNFTLLESDLALASTRGHARRAGDSGAVLLEREGVFLQADLRVEIGFPCAGDIDLACRLGPQE